MTDGTKIGVKEFAESCLSKYFESGNVIKVSVSILPTEPPDALLGHSAGRGFIKFELKMIKEDT